MMDWLSSGVWSISHMELAELGVHRGNFTWQLIAKERVLQWIVHGHKACGCCGFRFAYTRDSLALRQHIRNAPTVLCFTTGVTNALVPRCRRESFKEV